jgi:hypothetical protein
LDDKPHLQVLQQTFYTILLTMQEKIDLLSQKMDILRESQDRQNQELLSILADIKQGMKTKKRKSDLPEEQLKKLNEALCVIRDAIKQKLPDRPKFEGPVDKARIQEFEKELLDNSKIQECLDGGLLSIEVLHEKVLNCLGEQRRAPQRRQKYFEKKQKTTSPPNIMDASVVPHVFDDTQHTHSDQDIAHMTFPTLPVNSQLVTSLNLSQTRLKE